VLSALAAVVRLQRQALAPNMPGSDGNAAVEMPQGWLAPIVHWQPIRARALSHAPAWAAVAAVQLVLQCLQPLLSHRLLRIYTSHSWRQRQITRTTLPVTPRDGSGSRHARGRYQLPALAAVPGVGIHVRVPQRLPAGQADRQRRSGRAALGSPPATARSALPPAVVAASLHPPHPVCGLSTHRLHKHDYKKSPLPLPPPSSTGSAAQPPFHRPSLLRRSLWHCVRRCGHPQQHPSGHQAHRRHL
jgi:hypothetical protein